MRRAPACCAARSGASNQARRSRSKAGTLGQPNQAPCPLAQELHHAGLMASSPFQVVWNMFQPP
jgi:hypothetical protein